MKLNKRVIIGIAVILIAIAVGVICFYKNSEKTSLGLAFEEDFESLNNWKIYDYENDYFNNNVSTVELRSIEDNLGKYLYIENRELNDTRIYRELNVEPNSYYRVAFRVKSQKNGEEGIGANLSAIDCLETFSIDNTYGEWESEELYFETSSKQEKIKLSFGMGAYNEISSGFACFDEIKIEKVDTIPEDALYLMFTNAYKNNENDDANFAKEHSKLIFTILMGFVLVFSLVMAIKDKKESQEKASLTRKDLIIIIGLTLVCAIISFYKLGDNFGVSSFWKAGESGESITVTFEKETNVRAVAYSGNIPSSGYYKISYLTDEFDPEYVTAFTFGEDIDSEEKNRKPKSAFFFWQFNYGVDFSAKEVKIEAVKPGWGVNELAFFTLNEENEYELIPVRVKGMNTSDLSTGTPDMLFDEQDLVPTSSTYMNSTYFDEIYFPRTAYEQLNGLSIYELTHPPLGKIIISLGITIFGMNPFGWRVMGTLFGVLLVPLAYLFAFKIFKESKYAFIAGFLMLFDFMRLPQTRLATIDSYSTFFIIGMYYFMYDYFAGEYDKKSFKKSLVPLFLSGLMFGLGAATKWSCLYAGGGLAFIFFLTKLVEFLQVKKEKGKLIKEWLVHNFVPTCLWCVLFFVIIPLGIYVLSYIPYMASNPGKSLIDIVIDNQKYIFNYHSNLVDTHPFGSSWYGWPIITRPLWLYVNSVLPEGMYSTIASFGNPAVWWVGLALLPVAIYFIWRDKDKDGIILLTAYAFQYFPWILITRVSFIYSYFTALPFLIMLLVYCIKKMDNGKKWFNIIIGVYLAIVLVLFVCFFPTLMGTVVKKEYIEGLRWFSSWYF